MNRVTYHWVRTLATSLLLSIIGVCSVLTDELCSYDGLTAKCGELLFQLHQDRRQGVLHPKTQDLRTRIAQEGGNILLYDKELGIITARFDRDPDRLAAIRDRLLTHPAVAYASYNLLAVLDTE